MTRCLRVPTGLVLCRVVVEIGPGVRDLVVGDRVAIEPGVPCWTNRASRFASCPMGLFAVANWA